MPQEARRIGLVEGRYRIQRLLNRGGMADIYEVIHAEIGDHARRAMKVLSRELLGDREAVERFKTEARTLATIDSKYIVRVYDVGELEDGRPFFVMELVSEPWCTLSRWIQQGFYRDRPKDVFRVAHQVGWALEEIHARRIVHRDLKPDNIMAKGAGSQIKVIDFGIAANLARRRTLQGQVFGTPEYMAPEQVAGDVDRIDARTDLYALGIILYEMLAGRPPFESTDFLQVLRMHLHQPPAPLTALNPAVSDDVAKVVSWCLEKDPEKRPGSAQDLVGALARACGCEAEYEQRLAEEQSVVFEVPRQVSADAAALADTEPDVPSPRAPARAVQPAGQGGDAVAPERAPTVDDGVQGRTLPPLVRRDEGGHNVDTQRVRRGGGAGLLRAFPWVLTAALGGAVLLLGNTPLVRDGDRQSPSGVAGPSVDLGPAPLHAIRVSVRDGTMATCHLSIGDDHHEMVHTPCAFTVRSGTKVSLTVLQGRRTLLRSQWTVRDDYRRELAPRRRRLRARRAVVSKGGTPRRSQTAAPADAGTPEAGSASEADAGHATVDAMPVSDADNEGSSGGGAPDASEPADEPGIEP